MAPEDHVKTKDLVQNHQGESQLIPPEREEILPREANMLLPAPNTAPDNPKRPDPVIVETQVFTSPGEPKP
ncbi:MAG: hypothetical protein VYA34_11250 [Myxococcota bacterium]|nr:hypothetical protein [Myxococcota bacterium]